MSINFSRCTRTVALTASLFSGLIGLAYNPSPAYAQITCWVCVCSGTNCQCAQVACPKAPNTSPTLDQTE